MNHVKYIRLQLSVIREYSIRMEIRLGKSINRNILMLHWCKRYAKTFRKYVEENRLIE